MDGSTLGVVWLLRDGIRIRVLRPLLAEYSARRWHRRIQARRGAVLDSSDGISRGAVLSLPAVVSSESRRGDDQVVSKALPIPNGRLLHRVACLLLGESSALLRHTLCSLHVCTSA